MSENVTRKYGVADVPWNKSAEDSLNFAPRAASLSRFISNCDTPMTIGVQGGWGTGKTSLMRMVQENLDDHVIKVWINTWQYAQVYDKDNLPLWVIAGLVRGLERQISGLPKVAAKTKGLLGCLFQTFAETKLGVRIDFDEASKSEMDKLDGATIVERVQECFAKAVKTLTAESEVKRVVFFIDDLDRISPSIAVAILEAIKNFIDVPGCVFVLAIDFEVIVRGLQGRQGVEGREFFEKIIQVPFHLQHQSSGYDAYLVKHFAAIDGANESEFAARDLQSLFEPTTRMNPRAIKRAFNLYSLLKEIVDVPSDANARLLMLAMTCLQVSSIYWHVYRALTAVSSPELVLFLMRGDAKIPVSYRVSEQDQKQAQRVWEQRLAKIREAAMGSGRVVEDVDDDLRDIADFMIGTIDVDQDGKILDSERRSFYQVLDVSATTIEADVSVRRSIVSFADLRERGLVPKDGDPKLVFSVGKNQGKKVYMVFEGKQHRVAPSKQGGGWGERVSLRKLTAEYLGGLNYTPPNYADYWLLEGSNTSLSDLIATWREREQP